MTGRRWLPPLLWAAFILVLTSLPGDAVPESPVAIPHLDKLIHLGLYLVLGFLSARAIAATYSPATAFLLTVAVGAVFAALDELHQNFIPGRGAEVADWTADVAGLAIGAGAAVVFTRRTRNS